MESDLRILVQELHVPFKTTVRHASAARNVGESVWVEAKRNGVSGYGEGCPRPYVTGERVSSCLAWYEKHLAHIKSTCTSFDALRRWRQENVGLLDQSPI